MASTSPTRPSLHISCSTIDYEQQLSSGSPHPHITTQETKDYDIKTQHYPYSIQSQHPDPCNDDQYSPVNRKSSDNDNSQSHDKASCSANTDQAQTPTPPVYVTFSSRSAGSSSLFYHDQFPVSGGLRSTVNVHPAEQTRTTTTCWMGNLLEFIGVRRRRKDKRPQGNDRLPPIASIPTALSSSLSNIDTTTSSNKVLMQQLSAGEVLIGCATNTAATNADVNNNNNNNNDNNTPPSATTIEDQQTTVASSTIVADNHDTWSGLRSLLFSLPPYTRALAYCLILAGVLRFPCTGQWSLIRSVVWPIILAIYFITDLFVVDIRITQASSSLSSSGFQRFATIMTNAAPLTSWIAAFVFLSISPLRCRTVFTQLSNLEYHSSRLVQLHVVGALIVSAILFALIIGTVPSLGSTVVEAGNVVIWIFFNYLIIASVLLGLFSLLCRFHAASLTLYRHTVFNAGIAVTEAIQEHTVLMRLMRNNRDYLQWLIVPASLLYLSGAALSVFLMGSSHSYSALSTVVFQLCIALIMLILPLHSAALITAQHHSIQQFIRNTDLTESHATLIARNALIQECILLPSSLNQFVLFDLTITHHRLAVISYVIIASLLVLVRAAFEQTWVGTGSITSLPQW